MAQNNCINDGSAIIRMFKMTFYQLAPTFCSIALATMLICKYVAMRISRHMFDACVMCSSTLQGQENRLVNTARL